MGGSIGKFFFTGLCTLVAFGCASSPSNAAATRGADIAYDNLARDLELVRNQIELTIENHGSVRSDVSRQKRELEVLQVFQRIPLKKKDFKSDEDLIGALRADFGKASSELNGFRVRKVTFASKWRSSSRAVPEAVPYDVGFRATDAHVADSRDLLLEVEFDTGAPTDKAQWAKLLQRHVQRLVTANAPARWKVKGKRLQAVLTFYRFRDFEYPRLIAPDLGRYSIPGDPATNIQKAAVRRIRKYRREIVELWPKAQPYLSEVRAFALNDLRMSFFMKHASVH